MAAQNLSRKRPAPGIDPSGYPQPMQQAVGSYDPGLGPQLSNDEFLQWGQTSAQPQNNYSDPSGFSVAPPSYSSNNLGLQNQLARRPMAQVATRPSTNGNQWMPDPNNANQAVMNGRWEDNIDELEQKAQVAKREAAQKRKQIPPFVLKLRSFVEDVKNDDLIRWTEDGKSFVVLDEDDFAKKLIPELFKHNNYASFVRQLNMYGFHKKVGLSDNSMRASERKAKTPSEYSNPYFRRGYPELMWLIQKPKNVTAATKGKNRNKAEDEMVEDNEEIGEETNNEPRARPRPQLTLGDGSANSITQETLQSVQRELQLIRRQQAQISQMMAGLKREHEQLYGQAITFQDQHTRHENSINAILTFLATIYNRSLSGNDAAQSIANVFGSALPQDIGKSGTVVDVGDYNFNQFPALDEMGNKSFKKPQLLLTNGQTRAQTMSPASTASPMMSNARNPSQKPPSNTAQVQEVFDNNAMEQNNTAFKQNSRANGRQHNQQDMMSVIENTNARNPSPTTPVVDFTNALNDLENSRGNSPLSNAQRENVLRIINSRANQSGDNALINSNPPSGPANFDRHLASTKADLDALARMQTQQDQSVEKLTNLLQPLSPSGSIPGINDGQNLPPPPIDIEDFLSHNEYFADFPSDVNGNLDFANHTNPDGTFDWGNADADDDELFADVNNGNNSNMDFNVNNEYGDPNFLNVTDHDGGGRVESVASSEVTTPKHSSIGDEETGPTSRGKGRKLSTVEEGGVKKRRKS